MTCDNKFLASEFAHCSLHPQRPKFSFGSGEKISLAVKFGDKGSKILDPRLAPIRYVS